MKKTRHNPPRKKESKFIPFGKIQTRYLREVFVRTNNEFNQAVEDVYEELGIQERVSSNPDRFKIRLDFTGVDIVPARPKPPETPPEDPPGKDVPPPKKPPGKKSEKKEKAPGKSTPSKGTKK